MSISAMADTTSLPEPVVPANNPASASKIELGKRLFSEGALSATGEFSCASCHQPQQHFTDGLAVARGATGELHSRNTPTLYNVAYNASFGWDDQGIDTLEAQHLIPLENTDPVEMGFSPKAFGILSERVTKQISRPLFRTIHRSRYITLCPHWQASLEPFAPQ